MLDCDELSVLLEMLLCYAKKQKKGYPMLQRRAIQIELLASSLHSFYTCFLNVKMLYYILP